MTDLSSGSFWERIAKRVVALDRSQRVAAGLAMMLHVRESLVDVSLPAGVVELHDAVETFAYQACRPEPHVDREKLLGVRAALVRAGGVEERDPAFVVVEDYLSSLSALTELMLDGNERHLLRLCDLTLNRTFQRAMGAVVQPNSRGARAFNRSAYAKAVGTPAVQRGYAAIADLLAAASAVRSVDVDPRTVRELKQGLLRAFGDMTPEDFGEHVQDEPSW